jgi:molybdenum-dependent DNA-binding transcriptional regulator ModE
MLEVGLVSGGGDSCSAEGGGNNYGGVTDTTTLGQDLINAYEAAVEVVSYMIERVANAL